MKKFILPVIIAFLGIFIVSLTASAQTYEADYLIGNFIRATKVDADGNRWKVKIPNGTKIEVEKRIVEGETTDCRDIQAEFTYEGEKHTTEARWLKFSEDNPEGAVDIFAEDDFSPTASFVKKYLAFTRFNPLSSKGRFLYGLTLPILQFVLMVIALILILRSKTRLSAMPFILAVIIQVYYTLMLGDDALWWCLPEYQGIGGAIVGFIPLALFLVFEFGYIILVWTFSRTNIKLWPVIVAVILQYPAAVLSYALCGSLWIGVLAVYLLPIIINGIKGIIAIGETILLIIGMIGLNAGIAAAAFAGGKILAAVVTVCPLLAFLIGLKFKDKVGFHRFGVRQLPNGSWINGDGQEYASRSAAESAQAVPYYK